MKNVAGYDMTKLFVGSFGVLGVITEVTFRLLPRPDTQALLVLPLRSLAQGRRSPRRSSIRVCSRWCWRCSRPAWSPGSAPALAGPARSARPCWPAPALLAGFVGHGAAVARSVSEVRTDRRTEATACGSPGCGGRVRWRRWPMSAPRRPTAAGGRRRSRPGRPYRSARSGDWSKRPSRGRRGLGLPSHTASARPRDSRPAGGLGTGPRPGAESRGARGTLGRRGVRPGGRSDSDRCVAR